MKVKYVVYRYQGWRCDGPCILQCHSVSNLNIHQGFAEESTMQFSYFIDLSDIYADGLLWPGMSACKSIVHYFGAIVTSVCQL